MKRSPAVPPKAVALVTGASGGIGRACAEELARAGFAVFGTSRQPRRAGQRGAFPMLGLDVREDFSVEKCVDAVLSKAGRIDLLVNNAGVAMVGGLEEITIEDFKNVVDTNLFGTVRMMQAVLPAMRKQNSGRIVNIGSVSGFLPLPYSSAYCASKHAIRGLSESVDHEVRNLGIRVIVIEPGFIRTEIVEHSPKAAPKGHYGEDRALPVHKFQSQIEHGADPAVVARVVLEAATSAHPQNRYLPDTVARVVNVVRGVLPSGCFEFALRRYYRLD